MILNNNYGKLLGSCLQIFENVRKIISHHMLLIINALTQLSGLKSGEQFENLEVQIYFNVQ